MIDFICPQCHVPFSVPDHLAGRRATCRKCHAALTVPAPRQSGAGASSPGVLSPPLAAGEPVRGTPPAKCGPQEGRSEGSPSAPRLPPRLRRLEADARQMKLAFEQFPLIRIRAMEGQPPDLYQIEYLIRGLERVPGRREPVERNYHCVEIRLGYEYPRLSPACRMLTPIFHPNIEPATICVGDHWTAGERLVELVIRIGEMIAYQAYNIKSPLDAEAAMWADLHVEQLPVDNRNLRPAQLD